MAQTIKIKRSSTSGNKLTSSNSVAGELGLNTADKALYIQTGSSNGDVVTVAHESTLKIDEANNRVGIGTTSPSYPLDVHVADGNTVNFRSTDNRMQIRLLDNDTTGYLGVENSTFYLGLNAGIGEDNLSIKSDGSVGIGTTSPVANLDVKIAEETVANVLAGSYAAAFTSTTSGNTGHATGILLSGSSGSNRGAAIVAEAQGSGNNHDLIFSTSSSGATPTERMRIDDLGKVGIGITDPATNLHISSTDSSTFTIQNSTNAGNASLHFRDENNVDQYKVLYDLPNNRAEQHFNGNGLRFYSNQISAEVAKIGFGNGYNSSYFAGRVGIGTSSPSTTLHVDSVSDFPAITIARSTTASGLSFTLGMSDFGGGGTDLLFDGVGASTGFGFRPRNSSGSQVNGLIIAPSGNVGIGLTSPDKMFVVQGPGAEVVISDTDTTDTPRLRFRETGTTSGTIHTDASHMIFSAGGTSERMRIDSNGKILIGDTASHTDDLLQIETPASGGGHGIQIRRNDANGDQNIGTITFGNNTDTDLAQIKAKTDGDSNAGDSGALLFSTQVTSGSLTERMRITSAGNTIFGGTSVGAAGAMSVKVDGSYTDLYLYGAGTSQGGRIFFGDSSDRSSIVGTYGTGGGGKLSFKTDTTGGTSQDRLVIDSDGSIRFNNAYTFPTADGSANQVLKTDGSGNITFGTVTAGAASSLVDADGDTQIQVEESSDEDIIRFDVAGNEFATFAQTSSEHYFRLFRRGTTAKASFSFDGTGLKTDVDSGYHSLVVKNNGSEQLRVTSGGNVGISTTSPASRLQINGASSDSWNRNIGLSIDDTEIGKIVVDSAGIKYRTMVSGDHHYFRNSANNTTLLIRDDSKVGINETSPEGSLHISNAAQASLVLQGDASNSGDSGEIDAAIYMLMDKGAGTDPFGGTTHGAHGIRLSTENHSGATAFRIDDWDNGSYHSRMYINTSGDIGIGTTSPNSYSNQKVLTINGTTHSRIDFETADTLRGSIYGDSGSLNLDAGGNYIRFYTGNTQKMTLLANGNLGIGTTSPTHQLHVAGAGDIVIEDTAGGSAHLRLKSSASGTTTSHWKLKTNAANNFFIDNDQQGTSDFTITTDGNVGIGQSDPDNHINTGSYFKPDSSGKLLTLNGGADGSFLLLESSTTTDDDQIGGIYWTRTQGQSDAHKQVAGIDVTQVAYAPNNTLEGGMMRFFTKPSGGGINTPRMVIDGSGKVGIGETAPAHKLEVSGDGHLIRATGTTSGGSARIGVYNENDGSGNAGATVYMESSGWGEGFLYVGAHNLSATGGDFNIRAGSGLDLTFGNGTTEYARISGAGNFGIGTTTPSRKLDISASGNDGIRIASANALIGGGASGGDTQLIYWNGSNAYYGRSALGGTVSQHEFRTGGTTRLTINSSGNVGIGTTSPDAKLQVAYNGGHTSGNISLTHSTLDLYNPLQANTDEKGAILTFSDHYQDANGYPRTVRAAIKGGTDTVGNTADGFLAFYTDSGGANSATERMRITKDGRVGIGVTDPAAKLEVKHDSNATNGVIVENTTTGTGARSNVRLISDAAQLDIYATSSTYSGVSSWADAGVISTSSNASGGLIFNAQATGHKFQTGTVERMRINSSGDWMVSNTVANVASAYSNQGGCGWVDSDLHFEVATTSNRSAVEFGRNNGNSGDVITIRQQGTSVGMIGTEGGDSLVIQSNGSTGTGIRFHPSRAAVEPVRSGSTIDDTISLGADTRRFKDLHLSNTANIGHASIETSSTSTTATTQVAIATFAAATFRSAEFTIQVTNSTDSTYHMTKVLLIHDGTTPGITEYGTVFTGSAAEATFDADISSGNVRLLATPASTDSMTFKVVRHCITV